MDTPLIDSIADFYSVSPLTVIRTLITAAVLIGLWVLRWLLLWLVYSKTESPGMRYMTRKASLYIVIGLCGVTVLLVWFDDLRTLSVATYLGLLSAGIAIALKDLMTNMAGWVYIMLRRPLDVGDRVSIADSTGDVVDYNIFEFVIVEICNWVHGDQSTGRLIYVPNGMLFTKPLFNYTRGFDFIWEDMSFQITFESNWQKAKQLLLKILEEQTSEFVAKAEEDLKKATTNYYVYFQALTPAVYTAVYEDGIRLSLRYVVAPRKRRTTSQKVWEAVLTEFGKHNDIMFAYRTIRTFDNSAESKEGLRSVYGMNFNDGPLRQPPHSDLP